MCITKSVAGILAEVEGEGIRLVASSRCPLSRYSDWWLVERGCSGVPYEAELSSLSKGMIGVEALSFYFSID